MEYPAPARLIIDLREEHEIMDHQIVVIDRDDVLLLNIPSRNIFSNVDFINHFSDNFDVTYLLCKRGVRSNKIKDKYFGTNEKVISYQGGWKALAQNPSDMKTLGITIVNNQSITNLSPQQYMQLAFVAMLGVLVYLNNGKRTKTVNLLMTLVAGFLLIQFLNKDCIMARLVPLKNAISLN